MRGRYRAVSGGATSGRGRLSGRRGAPPHRRSRSPCRSRSRARARRARRRRAARPRIEGPSRRVTSTERPIVADTALHASADALRETDVPLAEPPEERRQQRRGIRVADPRRGVRTLARRFEVDADPDDRVREPSVRPPTTPRGSRRPSSRRPAGRSATCIARPRPPRRGSRPPSRRPPAAGSGRHGSGSSDGRTTNENIRAAPGSVRPRTAQAPAPGGLVPGGHERPLGAPASAISSAVALVEPVTSSKRTGASRPRSANARSSSITDSIRLTPSGASPIIASQPWRRNRRS